VGLRESAGPASTIYFNFGWGCGHDSGSAYVFGQAADYSGGEVFGVDLI
jgi:hypothetical protein